MNTGKQGAQARGTQHVYSAPMINAYVTIDI